MSAPEPTRFAFPARVLHWLMALVIVAMLFIGVGMISTASPAYPLLLAWHRPLGIAIVVLALVRLVVRLTHAAPALPADLPAFLVLAARASHYLLYAAMFAMPLIGWAMLSAAGSPVQMAPGVVLPPILPHDALVFGWLRWAHGVIGYLFFLLILPHLGAALFHGLVRRDGVLGSMASFKGR
jgi:cytochrome b561